MTTSFLDLFTPAELTFNYFNGHIDLRSGLPFMWTYLLTDPPKLAHDGWDTVEDLGRFLEGLVSLRVMTGSDAGLETELGCRDKLAEFQRDDGLIYRPRLAYTVPVADTYDQMSALQGLVVRYLADADPVCGRVIDATLAALAEAVSWDGKDAARFLHVGVRDGRPLSAYDGEVTETDNPQVPDEAWFGRLLRPALQYALATGREAPLVLARALARDIAFRSGRYGEDGSFSRVRHGEDSVWTNGHFHSRSNTVAAILRLARHTGDDDLFAWGERVFRWALGYGTSFGWYPEFIGRRDIETEGSETCCVVDMFDAAVTLARAGRTDCWEIADRIRRNQMLENQLRDVAWVSTTRERPDTETESYDRVPERALGGFAGWAGPNDLVSDFSDPYFSSLDTTQDHRRTLMGCCASSGAKGLYLAWHHALDRTDEGVTVNFAVSRDSEHATVRAFEPVDGRIEVDMKTAGTLSVRVPGRPDPADVTVTREGTPLEATWEADLLRIEHVEKGRRITVRYPLAERTETVTVGGRDFTRPVDYEVTWRGNTVIAISPEGKHCPLYRRRASLAADAPGQPRTGPVASNEFDY